MIMERKSRTLLKNSKRKAATTASRNLSIKTNNCIKKVSSLLRKGRKQSLSSEEKKFLDLNKELVNEFQKRQEKRAVWQFRQSEHEDSEAELKEKCNQLAQALHDADFLVVYTGAGISTSASIPDYRGPNGIWTKLQKGEDIGNHDLSAAIPTKTHMALSQLYSEGIVKHVVSQNCDGLHLRSGLPKTAMSEVHGNMYIEVCKNCKPSKEYVRSFDVTEKTSKFKHTTGRRCYKCGEPLIDSIVHFGERGRLRWPLNWQGACQAANACDTILCLGSSLKVLRKYPWLWQMDRSPNRKPLLYIVNLQWTPKDKDATLKINGRCDVVMDHVMNYLGMKIEKYSKERDPLFDIATPLHSDELLTTTQPILALPSDASILDSGDPLFIKEEDCEKIKKENYKKNEIKSEDKIKVQYECLSAFLNVIKSDYEIKDEKPAVENSIKSEDSSEMPIIKSYTCENIKLEDPLHYTENEKSFYYKQNTEALCLKYNYNVDNCKLSNSEYDFNHCSGIFNNRTKNMDIEKRCFQNILSHKSYSEYSEEYFAPDSGNVPDLENEVSKKASPIKSKDAEEITSVDSDYTPDLQIEKPIRIGLNVGSITLDETDSLRNCIFSCNSELDGKDCINRFNSESNDQYYISSEKNHVKNDDDIPERTDFNFVLYNNSLSISESNSFDRTKFYGTGLCIRSKCDKSYSSNDSFEISENESAKYNECDQGTQFIMDLSASPNKFNTESDKENCPENTKDVQNVIFLQDNDQIEEECKRKVEKCLSIDDDLLNSVEISTDDKMEAVWINEDENNLKMEDDDVKNIWFWGFDARLKENKESVSKLKTLDKIKSERVTRSNSGRGRLLKGVCRCSLLKPELCAKKRPKIPMEDTVRKARLAFQRKKCTNYKKFQPIFQLKLQSVTFERKKRRKKHLLWEEVEVDDDDDDDDDPDVQSQEDPEIVDESSVQNKDDVISSSFSHINTQCKEAKISPGWYGKGYRKTVKKRKNANSVV